MIVMKNRCAGLFVALSLVLFTVFAANAMASEKNEPSFRIWADVDNDNGLWTVVPRIELAVDSALSYAITADKTGRSGRSKTKQSGRLSVSSGVPVALASLRIGVGKEDSCVVDIQVYEGDLLRGNLTLTLPDIQEEQPKSP